MNLDEARQNVLEACLLLAGKGFLAGTGGNLALRAGQDGFVVTPSGRDYYRLAPSDLCVVRLADLRQVDGPYPPSVEAGLHARAFRLRPDVIASVHTHQPLASAMALLGIPVPVETAADRERLGPQLAAVPYAPSGTGLLVRALGRRIKPGTNAYLLRNHGLVCLGGSLPEAIDHLFRVERICAEHLRRAIQAQPTESAASRFALSFLP
jgi:L-fuculose-phosphate aldolase